MMDTKEEKAAESRYPRQDFIDHAQALFGVRPEAVAGALHGMDAQELTVGEVKKALNKFLNRKVK